MKKLAGLGFALVLLALASPAFSGGRPPGPLLPYCWNLDNTSCTTVGQTQRCTDGIWSDYVCTCRSYNNYPVGTIRRWDCPEVR